MVSYNKLWKLLIDKKMYKKDKPEYGRATKIINMSIEDFEKIKPDIIEND